MDNQINSDEIDDIDQSEILTIPTLEDILPSIQSNMLSQVRSNMIFVNLTENSENDILQRSFEEQKKIYTPTNEECINNLKRQKIESTCEDETCSICMELLKNNEEIVCLPCNHKFHINHEECEGILPWLKKHNTCPICREELPKRELTEEEEKEIEEEAQTNINEHRQQTNNIFTNMFNLPIRSITIEDGFIQDEINEAIRRSLE